MSQQVINVGAAPNDGTGDPGRTAWTKANANFTELYGLTLTVGASLAFAPPSGTIDPSIVGFVAGLGSSGTGRLKITLSGNTSIEGLPAGVDGQTLLIMIVTGAFTFTLLHLNGSTAQKQILASGDETYGLGDVSLLIYDGGLGQWALVL